MSVHVPSSALTSTFAQSGSSPKRADEANLPERASSRPPSEKPGLSTPKDVVQLSEDALRRFDQRELEGKAGSPFELKQNEFSAIGKGGDLSGSVTEKMARMEEHLHRTYERMKLNAAVELNKEFEMLEAHLEKLAGTEPVAAVKLNDDEVQAIVKALKQGGSRPSSLPDQDNSFILGDYLYSFKPDGSVYRNKNGIPNSEEQKQGWIEGERETLGNLSDMIDEFGGGKSVEEMKERLKELRA